MPGDGSNLPPNQRRTKEGEVHHWLLTPAGRGYGGEERGLESSQPQKAAGDSTVPIVRFHYIPSVFVFLSLRLYFSVRLSYSPSNQVLPLSSPLSLKKMDGQQKAFSLKSISGFMHAHTLSLNSMQRST